MLSTNRAHITGSKYFRNILARSASVVAYSWGVGSQGELGHSQFQTSTTLMGESYVQIEPRRLIKSRRFKTFAVGSHYTLALDHEGRLFHWGETPSRTKTNEPLMVDTGDVRFEKIACGKSHSAAVSTQGEVFTWGQNGSWMSGGGYLGHGDSSPVELPRRVDFLQRYGAKAADVVCGGRHTVIRTRDGELLSCGVGEYGRLGTGSSFDAPEPAPLDSLAEEHVELVAAGSSHTIALARSNKIFVWGRNDYGQLGFEDSYMDMYSLEDLPRELDADALRGKRVAGVLAGRGRSGAITSDGELFIWGHRAAHTPMLFSPSLLGGLRVSKAAFGGDIMGNSCTAIVTEDGGLWTLGDAGSHMIGRKLGMGQTSLSRLPEPVRVPALEGRRVLDVFMGSGQHMFATVEDSSGSDATTAADL